MKCLTAAIISILAIQIAEARLGESETELIGRFGDPISKNRLGMVFKKGDYMIVTGLDSDGICESIIYWKQGEFGNIPLTEKEIADLQRANGRGAKWTKSNDEKFDKLGSAWTAPNLVCFYEKSRDALSFYTQKGFARVLSLQGASNPFK